MAGLQSCILLLGQMLVLITADTFVVPPDPKGRLVVPPARNTLWRLGYNTTMDPNDDWVNCGSVKYGDASYDKLCGVCGDSFHYDQPREHETGGKYGGDGFIVGTYEQGQVMTVVINMTTPQPGFFEFRICSNNNNLTHACMNKNLLQQANSTRFYMDPHNYTVDLQLPSDLTCSHCVLQWRYTSYMYFYKAWTTDYKWVEFPTKYKLYLTSCADINITAPATPCKAVEAYATVPGMDDWCMRNCAATPPYCPDSHCSSTCLNQ